MGSNSNYDMNTYPSQRPPAAPSGMYSGQGYDEVPSKHSTHSKISPVVTYSEVTESTPPTAQLISKPAHQAQQDSAQPSKWNRILRVWKIASQTISTLLSTAMFISMVYTTIMYQITENTVRDGRTPWPKHAKLWPTFMLLATSGVTLILSIVVMLSYCCCYKKATASWKLTVVKYGVHLGVWLVVSALYRYEKGTNGNNNDLWGWSCSDTADAIQSQFDGVVALSGLCTLQTSSWETSLAEFALKLTFAIGHFVIYRKKRADEKQNFADGLGDATTGLVESIF